MAIIIPSKNIYEMNNPKIRDNVIDNVSVEQTVVKKIEDYDTIVFNQDTSTVGIGRTFRTDFEHNTTFLNILYIAVASCGVAPYYYEKEITIPKTQNNKYISYLYKGKNKQEENNIRFSIQCRKSTGTSVVNTSRTQIIGTPQLNYTTTESTLSYTLPELTTSITAHTGSTGIYAEATATITVVDETNLWDINIIQNNDNEYIANVKVLCGAEFFTAKSEEYGSIDPLDPPPDNYILTGTCIKYEPLSITLTFYGDIIGIDLTDGSVTYIKDTNGEIVQGKGNKPHSLSGNELLQDNAYYQTTENIQIKILDQKSPNYPYYSVYISSDEKQIKQNDKITINSATYIVYEDKNGVYFITLLNIFDIGKVYDAILKKNFLIKERLAENVLRQYANGKETATLLCDIADYYNESGEKVIDIKTDKMSFRLHDEVIPYVFGANGQDQPMSKYQDGSPKVFEVVGSNIIYDGAVWQELFLLEKKQENT